MDSPEATGPMPDFVACVYPLSGLYSETARYAFYLGVILLPIAPMVPWIAIAPVTNSVIYSTVVVIHSIIMASQPRSRLAPFDVDTIYATMISTLAIGPALYISILPNHIVVRWIRIASFSWCAWLVIGVVSAIISAARPVTIFEPCIAATSGAILLQPRDIELANFTCVYQCFGPSLGSKIRSMPEVRAIPSFNLTALFDIKSKESNLVINVMLVPGISTMANLLAIGLHFPMYLKREKRPGYILILLAPTLFVAPILFFELGFRMPNFPRGEAFTNAGQWSVLINAVLVILGAVYTGWKPRIYLLGMPFASHWRFAKGKEERRHDDLALSEIPPNIDQEIQIGQNDVEAAVYGFPSEHLSKSTTRLFEQILLDAEGSEIMPYTDDPKTRNETEEAKIARILSESGFL